MNGSAFMQYKVPTSECYSKIAKDKLQGSQHALQEVKQTPGVPGKCKIQFVGRRKGWDCGHMGCKMQTRVYTCPKVSHTFPKGGKSEIDFGFLLSKPLPKPLPHSHTHSLSLVAKSSRKSSFWKYISFMRPYLIKKGSIFSKEGLYWLLSSSSTLSCSLFHLWSSRLCCLPR